MKFGKKRKDEYNEVYDRYKDSGFEFDYNSRIGKSKSIFSSDMAGIPDGKANDDNMFVNCSNCGVYMDYIPSDDGISGGKWVCPVCGKKVRESTTYNQLERENDSFEQKWLNDDDYDEYDW